MISWKRRIGALVIGAVLIALLYVFVYDPIEKSPKQLHPPLLLFLSVGAFLMVNAIAMALNVLKAAVAVRHESEEEAEKILEPVLRGWLTDEQIFRLSDPSFFFALGLVASSTVICLLWVIT